MATGSIGTDIRLMIYPLKVEPLERQVAEAKPQEGEPPEPAESTDSGEAPDVDASVLAEAQRDREALAYRTLEADPEQKLAGLEQELNGLLRQGDVCANAEAIDKLAHRILLLAPYDRAAYHALVLTGIVQQDLKMIYLMSKIGLRALFLSRVYDYELPQAVEAQLRLWQGDVFDPARSRAGRELVLEIVDCDGRGQVQRMPSELLAVDIPREALAALARQKARANFSYFKGLDSQTFLDRLHYLIDEAVAAGRRPQGEDAVVIALDKAPERPVGMLELDLSSVDLFGAPDAVPFSLRRERGNWVTYRTDADRRKALLLPVGNYYLRVGERVAKVFTVQSRAQTPVTVGERGRVARR